jgi:hypothetical protein
MKAGLKAYILADSNITAVIGQKCYSFPAPQDAAKPYIVLNRISELVIGTVNESLNICNELWQIDVYSDTDLEAENINDLLIDRLDYADRVEMGSYTVYTSSFDSEIDGSEIEMEASENADIRKTLTFAIKRDRTPTT